MANPKNPDAGDQALWIAAYVRDEPVDLGEHGKWQVTSWWHQWCYVWGRIGAEVVWRYPQPLWSTWQPEPIEEIRRYLNEQMRLAEIEARYTAEYFRLLDLPMTPFLSSFLDDL